MDKRAYEKEAIRERVSQLGLQGRHIFIDALDFGDVNIIPFFKDVYEFIEGALENK